MANTIKATVELDAKGALKEVEKLKKEVTATRKETESLKRALAQTDSATARVSATGGRGKDREEYRVARAGIGTGAEGRDFAKQAQGLGGLVHVYATFAANIFAVTAAYTALDKAFSVSRLEQAADIMSGKLGYSIRNLSKNLIEATGHSISFQEAMQFSAMGTAAGLTGKQLVNLTVIAKGAANALGRDMGDAVRRIVQGTAKQEQEILDELGIFVRAKTAYANYAKTLGLSGADALTATQRVQAYALAVEEAGAKWKDFAAIEDPFAKFTATFKEAGVELLNVVNSAITPILKFLSESKSLVEGIIVLITAKLMKMAVPHLEEGLTKFFTVDVDLINREADRSKIALLASNKSSLDALEAQKKQYHTKYVAKSDLLTESIEKDEILLAKKQSQRNLLLNSYDKEIEKKKLSIELSKLDNSLASTKGLSSTQFKARLESPILPKVDLGNVESVTKAMQSTVAQQIKRGDRATQQIALEKAIAADLITQNSTLKNIVLSETAHLNIKENIYQKQKLTSADKLKEKAADARLSGKILELDGQIEITNRKIAKATAERGALDTANGIKRVALEAEINDLVAIRTGLEASRDKHTMSGNAALAAQKIAQSELLKGVSLDIGDAQGFKGLLNIVKTIPGVFAQHFGMASGIVGSFSSALKLAMFTGSLAIRGLMAAMGPLMLIWAAWDIAIDPLLRKFGILSDKEDRVAEASKKLVEEADAARIMLGKLNDELSRPMSGEELSQVLTKKAQALMAAQAAIDKALEEMRIKQADKLGGDKTYSRTIQYGGPEGGVTEKSALLQEAEALTTKITAEDLGTPEYEKLLQIRQELYNLDIRSDILKKAGKGNDDWKERTALGEQLKGVTSFVEKQTQRQSAEVESIIGPSKAANAALEQFVKTHKKIGDDNIKALGILDTGLQEGYAKAIKSIDTLETSKSKMVREDTADSLLKNYIDSLQLSITMIKNGGEMARTEAVEAQRLFKIIKSSDPLTDAAKNATKDLKKKYLDFWLLLQSEHKLPKEKAGPAESKLDYSMQINKQELEQLKFLSRAKTNSYQDNLKYIDKIKEKTTEQAYLEMRASIKQIETDKKAGKTFEDGQENTLRRQAIERKNIAVQTAGIDAQNETYNLGIKRLEQKVKVSESLIDSDASYNDMLIQTTRLLDDQLALLKAQSKEGENQVAYAKERSDLLEKDRLTKLKAAEHLSVAELMAGGFKDIGGQNISTGKLIGQTTVASMAERTSTAEKAQTGPIEGSINAFEKGVDSSMTSLMDSIQTGSEITADAISRSFRNAASDVFKQLAVEQAKLAAQKAAMSIMSLFGVGGGTGGGMASLAGSSSVMSESYSAPSTGGFANGGIMSEFGPLQLNKYANGGVASSPQLAVFGEGRMNEAYVPLPDGRSIPVTMEGITGGGNNIQINVNVAVSSTGTTSETSATSSKGQTDAMASLGNIISTKVKEEIINQMRPSGLLAR